MVLGSGGRGGWFCKKGRKERHTEGKKITCHGWNNAKKK
jgi:hypothetical protein